MVESLRRLLWLVPLLTLGAGGLFLLLTHTIARPAPGEYAFFNPEPRDAENEANAALGLLESDPARASSRLVELGGAALPHVLSRLDTLSVKQQLRVAVALWPLTERMGLQEHEAVPSGDYGRPPPSDEQLAFWRQYYEEHEPDFRPLAVQRLVKRLSARDLRLRRADLLIVDTFALPALVSELGRVRTERDVERVRRVAALIAHVSQRPFRLAPSASVADAKKLATDIRNFWDRRGGPFIQMGELERLSARLVQTEFSVWIRQSSRQLSGLDASALAERLARGIRVSGPLFALGLLGSLVVGPALAALVQVLQMRDIGSSGRHAPIRVGLALGLCMLVPAALLNANRGPLLLGLLSLGAGTLSSAYLLQRELSDRIDWRTRYVLARQRGLGRVRAVARWLGPSIPTLAPLAAAEAALWVTCLERSAQLPGLGSATLNAVAAADLPWLMMTGLGLGVVTGGMQLVCDAVLGTNRIRWRDA